MKSVSSAALFVLALAGFANAGLFPASSKVKPLEAKNWKKALKEDRAYVVAFVAPWCGHCQRLVPEMSKAAASMEPLVPFYAVDCDADANKQLCSAQGVKGFPTVKMFPRGLKLPPQDFQEERSSAKIFSWAQRTIPAKIQRVKKPWGVSKWKNDNRGKARAILLNKSHKMPLLWKVLANRYADSVSFANIRDYRGMTSKAMGFPPQPPEADKESRVLVIPKDGKDAVMYKGTLKYDSLVPFLDSLAKGELDLDTYPVADPKVVEEGEKEVKEAMDRNETFEEDEKQEHKGKKKSSKASKGAGSEEL